MHIADFVSGSLADDCSVLVNCVGLNSNVGVGAVPDIYSDYLQGGVGFAVGYPLDTVKVRIQTQKQYTGIWQCIVTTFSKEGVRGFFKGMALPLTTVSMTSSVAFGTYRNCLHCLSQARGAGGGPNTKLEVFLSGLAGGVAQTSVMAPGDIVKVRLQCQTQSKKGPTNTSKPKYRGPVHCLLSILKEDGVRGLYRGALPLMLRDGPSYGVYFLMYRTASELLTDFGEKKPGWVAVMFGGAAAGMSAWTLGTPMDVVKARLQMDGLQGEKRYNNFFHCLTETLRTEGAGVFFRSLGLNYIRAIPVSMLVFLTYEVITAFLQTSPDHTDTPPVGFE